MPRDAARWHHALMDLGATVCRARPSCDACPVASLCRARGSIERPAPRRQAAFATSTRRLRGVVLRTLADRRRGMTRRAMDRLLADERASAVIDELVREELIESAGSRLRLPI